MKTAKITRRIALGVTALFAVSTIAACGSVGEKKDAGGGETKSGGGEQKKVLNVGWIPWDEDIVATHLWKQELEKKGYTVNLKNVDPALMYDGMASGSIDFFLDGWLPLTHKTYWEKNKANLEDLGIWHDQAGLTITVPDYVKDVKSIADLKGKSAQFEKRIVGIDPGAGLTATTEKKAMPAYGLSEYVLKKSSTSSMLASLEKAINEKRPIVVTLWRPHWAYAKWKLRDLEDPKGAMGGSEKIHIIARKGFSKDFPEVAGWLKSFKMDADQLGTIEDTVLQKHRKGEEAEGVAEWTKANQPYVDGLTK